MKPKSIANMLGAFQRRHNIGRQILAVEVVKTAQEELLRLVQPPLRDDVRAQSFVAGTLVLACRHATARAAIQPFLEPLRLAITAQLGQVDLSLAVRLAPQVWVSDERYS